MMHLTSFSAIRNFHAIEFTTIYIYIFLFCFDMMIYIFSKIPGSPAATLESKVDARNRASPS